METGWHLFLRRPQRSDVSLPLSRRRTGTNRYGTPGHGQGDHGRVVMCKREDGHSNRNDARKTDELGGKN